MLGSISRVLLSADFFKKNSFRNTIRVSNSLDPDQAQHCVGLDLGLNYLQRLSADDTGIQRVKVGVVFKNVNCKSLEQLLT